MRFEVSLLGLYDADDGRQDGSAEIEAPRAARIFHEPFHRASLHSAWLSKPELTMGSFAMFESRDTTIAVSRAAARDVEHTNGFISGYCISPVTGNKR